MSFWWLSKKKKFHQQVMNEGRTHYHYNLQFIERVINIFYDSILCGEMKKWEEKFYRVMVCRDIIIQFTIISLNSPSIWYEWVNNEKSSFMMWKLITHLFSTSRRVVAVLSSIKYHKALSRIYSPILHLFSTTTLVYFKDYNDTSNLLSFRTWKVVSFVRVELWKI